MSGEPPPGTGDEAAHHAAYLSYYREDLIAGVLALSRDEQRRARVPSGWTPLQLLVHVQHMEQRWFVWRFLGEDVADPFGDWEGGDPADDSTWAVDDSRDSATHAAALRAVGERTTAILREHALDEKVAEFRGAEHDALDLRWICFHVLQEYARHAGHLDIVSELGGGPPRD
ncbi:putative damage-inducible protein DinB [Nocardioides ginsengisegetis]|uniref:Putative damage-inducible protein DinB n=1 Tax=Nocardioides ginsengisegetis TaxID=661491 RepID=A0A7W3J1P3_9ACTN|nr:putative damage-inducible protein DinB [Nocardioides ginsengisegetis]